MIIEKPAISEEWRKERFLEKWWHNYSPKGKAEIYQTVTGRSVEEAMQEKFMGDGKHCVRLE